MPRTGEFTTLFAKRITCDQLSLNGQNVSTANVLTAMQQATETKGTVGGDEKRPFVAPVSSNGGSNAADYRVLRLEGSDLVCGNANDIHRVDLSPLLSNQTVVANQDNPAAKETKLTVARGGRPKAGGGTTNNTSPGKAEETLDRLSVTKTLSVAGSVVDSSVSSIVLEDQKTLALRLTNGTTMRADISSLKTGTGLVAITFDNGNDSLCAVYNSGRKQTIPLNVFTKLTTKELYTTKTLKLRDFEVGPTLSTAALSNQTPNTLELHRTDGSKLAVDISDCTPNGLVRGCKYDIPNDALCLGVTGDKHDDVEISLSTKNKLTVNKELTVNELGTLNVRGSVINLGSDVVKNTSVINCCSDVVFRSANKKVVGSSSTVAPVGSTLKYTNFRAVDVHANRVGIHSAKAPTQFTGGAVFGDSKSSFVAVGNGDRVVNGELVSNIKLGGGDKSFLQLQRHKLTAKKNGALSVVVLDKPEGGTKVNGKTDLGKPVFTFASDRVSSHLPLSVAGAAITSSIKSTEYDAKSSHLKIHTTDSRTHSTDLSAVTMGQVDKLSVVPNTSLLRLTHKNGSYDDCHLETLKNLTLNGKLRVQSEANFGGGVTVTGGLTLYERVDGDESVQLQPLKHGGSRLVGIGHSGAATRLALDIDTKAERFRLGQTENPGAASLVVDPGRGTVEVHNGAMVVGGVSKWDTLRQDQLFATPCIVSGVVEQNDIAEDATGLLPLLQLQRRKGAGRNPQPPVVPTTLGTRQVFVSNTQSELLFTKPGVHLLNGITSKHGSEPCMTLQSNGRDAMQLDSKQVVHVHNKLFVDGAGIDSSVKAFRSKGWGAAAALTLKLSNRREITANIGDVRAGLITSAERRVQKEMKAGQAERPVGKDYLYLKTSGHKTRDISIPLSNLSSLNVEGPLQVGGDATFTGRTVTFDPATAVTINTEKPLTVDGHGTGGVALASLSNLNIQSTKLSADIAETVAVKAKAVNVTGHLNVNGTPITSSPASLTLDNSMLTMGLSNGKSLQVDLGGLAAGARITEDLSADAPNTTKLTTQIKSLITKVLLDMKSKDGKDKGFLLDTDVKHMFNAWTKKAVESMQTSLDSLIVDKIKTNISALADNAAATQRRRKSSRKRVQTAATDS